MNPTTFAFLIRRIRLMVYSTTTAIGILLFIISQFNGNGVFLGRWYAYSAVILLYFSLLASPLYAVFPALPYKPIYIKARKALGVSAFFFGFFHAYLAFFKIVGGFAALPYITGTYLLSLLAGLIALIILTVMAITSLDRLIQKLGRYWKPLHRFVYLAAVLILLHGTTISAHFLTMTGSIIILYAAITFLLGLEAVRLDKHLAGKFGITFQPAIFIAYPISAFGIFWLFFFSSK